MTRKRKQVRHIPRFMNNRLTLSLPCSKCVPVRWEYDLRLAQVLDDRNTFCTCREEVVHLEEHDLEDPAIRTVHHRSQNQLTPRLYMSALV